MDDERAREIDGLLDSLGMSPPNDYELYQVALTHSSHTYENRLPALENYERLEFLGDAVLKLLVSEYLLERFPEYREGELTKIRAVVVSDAQLAELAYSLQLGEYMVFGASESRTGGASKASNLACGLEALLGALFLDGKMGEARAFLRYNLADMVTEVDLSKTKNNYKAVLQEFLQAERNALPIYDTVEETGPAHSRQFRIEVRVEGEVVGYGLGKTKKEAQQNAARQALEVLNQ